jgi:SAM-dependent methyltransferase
MTSSSADDRGPSVQGPRGLAPHDPAFDISDPDDVAALLSAEERHFWHQTRNRFIEARLGRLSISPGARVVELGCGAGCVAAALARAGYELTGVDGHGALIDVARTRAPGARFYCRDLRTGAGDLPASSFDVACLFDVIEHLDRPEQALDTAVDLVRPGGYVVGTVPALMALWSGIDEHAGHKTRYSRASLTGVLSRVQGASIVEVSSFFRSLVPLMWAQRRIVGRRAGARAAVRNLSVPPKPVNAALFAMVTIEHALGPALDKLSLPGASLWFALRKSEESVAIRAG